MKKLLLWLLMGALMKQSVCWGADGGKENKDWAEGEHMVKLVRDKVGDTKRYYFWVKYGSLEAAVTEILSWDKKHYNVSYQEARGFLKQFEHEFYLNGDPPKLKLPECKNFYQGEKKGWMIRNDKELGDLYDTKNNQEVEAEIVFIDKNNPPSQEIAKKILNKRVSSLKPEDDNWAEEFLKPEDDNWAEESLKYAFTDSTNQEVKEEIKNLILIAQPDLENEDTLSDSIIEGKIELAKFLIKNKGKLNINLDKKTMNGETLLHIAIALENKEIVELLLKNKADPNMKNKFGETSLFTAVMRENEEIVELLLKNKADPNMKDKYGINSLHTAVFYQNLEIVKMLLAKNADPNMKDKYGITSLHTAVFNQNLEIVELLLENKADPNIQKNQGETSLHIAVFNQNLEIVKMLLAKNADPNIRDNNQKTPMALLSSLPATKEVKEIAQLLKDASFKPKPVSGLSTSKKVGIALIVSLGGLAILYKGYYLLFSQKPSKKEKGEAEKTEAKQKV